MKLIQVSVGSVRICWMNMEVTKLLLVSEFGFVICDGNRKVEKALEKKKTGGDC